jgi:predicted SAM-dependent methyltransferase
MSRESTAEAQARGTSEQTIGRSPARPRDRRRRRDPIEVLSRGCRYAWYRARAAGRLRTFDKPYRLHIGCGKNHMDDWINVDVRRTSVADLAWDVTLKFPFEEGSCRYIYNEAFLEHLTVDQGLAFMRECRRLLEPGGVLRIAMPSVQNIVNRYLSDDWKQQDWLAWPEYAHVETRAEMMNMSFRAWGHEWIYDRDELHRRLREAGFTEVADVAWGESEHAALRGLEIREGSKLVCEATKSGTM